MAMIPEEHKVEVDMVPYIDIVSLLLMFLLIVGDMTKGATAVKMKLPKADQAESEKKLGVDTEGRIVVQMQKDGSKYWAVVEKNKYDLVSGGNNQSLTTFLNELVQRRAAKGGTFEKGPNGEVKFPVKLRIPADAPMFEVERVVMNCVRAGLVNVHYATESGNSYE